MNICPFVYELNTISMAYLVVIVGEFATINMRYLQIILIDSPIIYYKKQNLIKNREKMY